MAVRRLGGVIFLIAKFFVPKGPPEPEGEEVVIGPVKVQPPSDAEALKAALWALQEFLILHPESAHVPEGYYALSHLYLLQGQRKMALDQLDILSEQFRDTLWSVYGRYVAGRTWFELGAWRRAEREMLLVVDSSVDHPLRDRAFLWAAQSQVELGKYEEAATCFRKALAHETADPLAAKILYNIALCMERSGGSPLEVQERYIEVRSRYPGTEYACRADYRVAHMALAAGQYEKAVGRYEFFLSNWPIEGERSLDACRDLIHAYRQTDDYVRAALLGEIMCATFGHEPQYWEALPALLEVYTEAGLPELGLDVIERSLAVAPQPAQQWYATVAKARFLLDLERYDEAEELLDQIESEVQDEELLWSARLERARWLIAKRDPEQGLELCRQVALESRREGTQARALRLMGRHCELTKQFDKAAWAYAGKWPADVGGNVR